MRSMRLNPRPSGRPAPGCFRYRPFRFDPTTTNRHAESRRIGRRRCGRRWRGRGRACGSKHDPIAKAVPTGYTQARGCVVSQHGRSGLAHLAAMHVNRTTVLRRFTAITSSIASRPRRSCRGLLRKLLVRGRLGRGLLGRRHCSVAICLDEVLFCRSRLGGGLLCSGWLRGWLRRGRLRRGWIGRRWIGRRWIVDHIRHRVRRRRARGRRVDRDEHCGQRVRPHRQDRGCRRSTA
jgi:hypothetical protein